MSITLKIKIVFQEEDKEEMKEILEMKRTHDRLYKKRMARLNGEDMIPEIVK